MCRLTEYAVVLVDQLRGHHPQRTKSLRDQIGYYVAIVILQRKHHSALRLNELCD